VLLWTALAALVLAACSGAQPRKEEPPPGRHSALHFFNKGNEAYEGDDFPRAVYFYKRAVKHDPQAADAYYNMGLAFYHMEAYDRAAQALRRALDVGPERADVHYNLALTYNRLYDLAAADRHYNRYRSLVAAREGDAAQGGATAVQASLDGNGGSGATAQGRATNATNEPAPDGRHRASAQPEPQGQAGGDGGGQGAGDIPAPRERDAMQRDGGTSAERDNAGLRERIRRQRQQARRDALSGSGASGRGSETLGGNGKWWTQDRFIPNQ